MQHNLMSAVVTRLLVLVSILMLSACVTEMEGRKVSNVDEKKALELHIQLASGYVQKKNRESARHHLKKAFEIDKNSTGASAVLARLYELEGEPKLAEEQYRRVLRQDNSFTEARNYFGLFLYRAKRYEEAF